MGRTLPTDPDRKKKCPGCNIWKPRREYYTAGSRSKVMSRCIPCHLAYCRERDNRRIRDDEMHRAYMRARSRAMTRLRKMYPEAFDLFMSQEMEREGYPSYNGRTP